MTIAIKRQLTGRRVTVGGRSRCVKATTALVRRGARACTRLVRAASALRRSGTVGANSLVFSGRVGSKRLAPGVYRATIVVTDAAGNRSTPRHTGFRIVK